MRRCLLLAFQFRLIAVNLSRNSNSIWGVLNIAALAGRLLSYEGVTPEIWRSHDLIAVSVDAEMYYVMLQSACDIMADVIAVLLARESTQASRWWQAFGMSNLRYTYCFRTRQNQDAARPTRFPDHGASRGGQSRAACSLVSLPTFRRYQGTAEDHGQDCGTIQKVRCI